MKPTTLRYRFAEKFCRKSKDSKELGTPRFDWFFPETTTPNEVLSFIHQELIAIADEVDARAGEDVFKSLSQADTIQRAYKTIASLIRAKANELR